MREIRTGLKLPDLHSSRTSQNICSLSHQTGRVNFCPGRNDLRLSNPLLLSRRRQRCRDFGAEDNILDENTLNGDTPLVRNVTDDFCNFKGDSLALSDHALDCAGTNDMSERRLSAFNQGLTEVLPSLLDLQGARGMA